MKKLITASILLLCLGNTSFAQTAKASTAAAPKARMAQAEKLRQEKIIQAKKANNALLQRSAASTATTPIALPEVSLPVTKQN